jgi:hypothetical protein
MVVMRRIRLYVRRRGRRGRRFDMMMRRGRRWRIIVAIVPFMASCGKYGKRTRSQHRDQFAGDTHGVSFAKG